MTSPAEFCKQSIAIAFAEKAAHAVETSLPEIFGGKAIQIDVRVGRDFKYVDMVTSRIDLPAHELDIADATYNTQPIRKPSEALMKMN